MGKPIIGDTVKILENTFTEVPEGTIGVVTDRHDLAAAVLVSWNGVWIKEHNHIDENNFHLWFWNEEVEVM